MPNKTWFLVLFGETFGPFSTEVLTLMVKQGRVHFTDYVWTSSLTKWVKVEELHEFASLLPPYPAAPIPSKAEEVEPEIAPKKAAKFVRSEKVKAKAAAPPPPPEATEQPRKKALIRRDERVPFDGRIEIKGHGAFEAVNLSSTGVFMEAAAPLPIGTDVHLMLSHDAFSKALEMTGVVIRHGDALGKSGFAVDFTRVNPAHKRVLMEYVQSRSGQET